MNQELYFFHESVAYPANTSVWVQNDPDAIRSIDFLSNTLQQTPIVDKAIPFSGNQAESKPVKETVDQRIAFYVQSDTLANSLSEILEFEYQLNIKIYVPSNGKTENADTFLTNKGIPFEYFSPGSLKRFNPKTLVLFNDWTKEAQRILAHCKKLRIASICIQESIIDFGDTRVGRMRHADYVFVQGAQTVLDLKRDTYYITGNPRYEKLRRIDSKSEGTGILVNCNFTYNIHEEVRDQWLADIAYCSKECGTPFSISQHPRDTGDLSMYENVIPSNSGSVANQILDHKIVITRFSSLIHEALILNRTVIYYNPHKEQLQYNFRFNDTFLMYCETKEELLQAIQKQLNLEIDQEAVSNYLAVHCIQEHSYPAKNILSLLKREFSPSSITFTDRFRMILFHPVLLKPMQKVLNLFRK